VGLVLVLFFCASGIVVVVIFWLLMSMSVCLQPPFAADPFGRAPPSSSYPPAQHMDSHKHRPAPFMDRLATALSLSGPASPLLFLSTILLANHRFTFIYHRTMLVAW